MSETETLPCTRCKGEGKNVHQSFTTVEGKVYPETVHPCRSCGATGKFPKPELDKIKERVLATKGKNKGKIRAAFPAPYDQKGVNFTEVRAYYVWRLARFHGGKDHSIPVTADMLINGDPFRKELDQLANQVAKDSFGSNMHAAFRWGKALGAI